MLPEILDRYRVMAARVTTPKQDVQDALMACIWHIETLHRYQRIDVGALIEENTELRAELAEVHHVVENLLADLGLAHHVRDALEKLHEAVHAAVYEYSSETDGNRSGVIGCWRGSR